MATLYKRGDSYYLNWSEAGRQRRESLGAISALEAETCRVAKEYELRSGQRVFLPSVRFSEFVAEYLEWHRVSFPDSHFRVEQICRDCFGQFNDKLLADIKKQDIERWLAHRVTRVGHNRHGEQCVVSSETAAKEFRTLKAVLSKAVEWGKLTTSPAQGIKPPKNKRSRPIHYYSKAELSVLYEHAELAPVWRLMANTGMRRAEAQQLKWEDVKEDCLHILSTEDARTKSGKWRQVPLSEGAKQALSVLRLETGDTPYVLPRMTGPSLSRAFLRDIERCGLKGSLHSLRHSYGSHLVMAGVPLRTVQALMGHQSFTTTERYAHVGKDHLLEQAKAISL